MTRIEIAGEIRALAELMLDVAISMDYYGGFDGEMQQHAKELSGASGQVLSWADGIEAGQS